MLGRLAPEGRLFEVVMAAPLLRLSVVEGQDIAVGYQEEAPVEDELLEWLDQLLILLVHEESQLIPLK